MGSFSHHLECGEGWHEYREFQDTKIVYMEMISPNDGLKLRGECCYANAVKSYYNLNVDVL